MIIARSRASSAVEKLWAGGARKREGQSAGATAGKSPLPTSAAALAWWSGPRPAGAGHGEAPRSAAQRRACPPAQRRKQGRQNNVAHQATSRRPREKAVSSARRLACIAELSPAASMRRHLEWERAAACFGPSSSTPPPLLLIALMPGTPAPWGGDTSTNAAMAGGWPACGRVQRGTVTVCAHFAECAHTGDAYARRRPVAAQRLPGVRVRQRLRRADAGRGGNRVAPQGAPPVGDAHQSPGAHTCTCAQAFPCDTRRTAALRRRRAPRCESNPE